ncbi:MAG: hypothetical protein RLZZ142_706 [Verrucomicrobiota bacterium]
MGGRPRGTQPRHEGGAAGGQPVEELFEDLGRGDSGGLDPEEACQFGFEVEEGFEGGRFLVEVSKDAKKQIK